MLAAILGVIFDSWCSLLWVIVYDLFSVTDAPDVSGILSFVRGVASLIVPALQSLILAATTEKREAAAKEHGGLLPAHSDDALLISSALSSSSFSSHSSFSSSSDSPKLNQRGKASRSLGNQLVMVMLCVFLIIACLLQYVMYFLVIRKCNDKKEGGLSQVKEPEQISSPSQKKRILSLSMKHLSRVKYGSNEHAFNENSSVKK